MTVTLNDVLGDLACAVGLDPKDLIVPDVKISGYILPKYFGPVEAVAEVLRATRTFTFETPR